MKIQVVVGGKGECNILPLIKTWFPRRHLGCQLEHRLYFFLDPKVLYNKASKEKKMKTFDGEETPEMIVSFLSVSLSLVTSQVELDLPNHHRHCLMEGSDGDEIGHTLPYRLSLVHSMAVWSRIAGP